MEAFFSNITLSNYTYWTYSHPWKEYLFYVPLVIVIIVLPLTILAIYTLYYQVQSNNVTPIYVINLLISDVFQLCCMIYLLAKGWKTYYSFLQTVYYFGLMASVGFMVCVALERYLVIAWPLWYRFRRTIKFSVVVCLVVWNLTLVYDFLCYVWAVNPVVQETAIAAFLLTPFPLLIFFLAGTLKALCAAISVSSEEKRSIVGVLVLVLLNYMLLFLPRVIFSLLFANEIGHIYLDLVSRILIAFSPLADLILYVFMRKGATGNLLARLCCCKIDTQQQQIPTVYGHGREEEEREKKQNMKRREAPSLTGIEICTSTLDSR